MFLFSFSFFVYSPKNNNSNTILICQEYLFYLGINSKHLSSSVNISPARESNFCLSSHHRDFPDISKIIRLVFLTIHWVSVLKIFRDDWESNPKYGTSHLSYLIITLNLHFCKVTLSYLIIQGCESFFLDTEGPESLYIRPWHTNNWLTLHTQSVHTRKVPH